MLPFNGDKARWRQNEPSGAINPVHGLIQQLCFAFLVLEGCVLEVVVEIPICRLKGIILLSTNRPRIDYGELFSTNVECSLKQRVVSLRRRIASGCFETALAHESSGQFRTGIGRNISAHFGVRLFLHCGIQRFLDATPDFRLREA